VASISRCAHPQDVVDICLLCLVTGSVGLISRLTYRPAASSPDLA
jgi:hypothetical protein